MRGWKGQPARHALAAHGLSVNEKRSYGAVAPVRLPTPKPSTEILAPFVYEQVVNSAFGESSGSLAAESLLADRAWLKRAIQNEAARLDLNVVQTAKIENELLKEFGQSEAIIPAVINAADTIVQGGDSQ